MNQEDCPICLNTLQVPVRLTLFDKGSCKCNKNNNVCLVCAKNLLKMDKSDVEKIGKSICCPFCNSKDTKSHLIGIKSNNSYLINYILMQQLTDKRKQNLLESFTCDCGQKFDDQLFLLDHYKRECPEWVIKCECLEKVKRKDLEQHKDLRCSYHSKKCPLCRNYLSRKKCNKEHISECLFFAEESLKKYIDSYSTIELTYEIMVKNTDNLLEIINEKRTAIKTEILDLEREIQEINTIENETLREIELRKKSMILARTKSQLDIFNMQKDRQLKVLEITKTDKDLLREKVMKYQAIVDELNHF